MHTYRKLGWHDATDATLQSIQEQLLGIYRNRFFRSPVPDRDYENSFSSRISSSPHGLGVHSSVSATQISGARTSISSSKESRSNAVRPGPAHTSVSASSALSLTCSLLVAAGRRLVTPPESGQWRSTSRLHAGLMPCHEQGLGMAGPLAIITQSQSQSSHETRLGLRHLARFTSRPVLILILVLILVRSVLGLR